MSIDIEYFDKEGKQLHYFSRVTSTDIIIFFDQCVRQKRDISAFHFNNVYNEFSDLFYRGKSYKTTMSSFTPVDKACTKVGKELTN